jgi:hypothetical protein
VFIAGGIVPRLMERVKTGAGQHEQGGHVTWLGTAHVPTVCGLNAVWLLVGRHVDCNGTCGICAMLPTW